MCRGTPPCTESRHGSVSGTRPSEEPPSPARVPPLRSERFGAALRNSLYSTVRSPIARKRTWERSSRPRGESSPPLPSKAVPVSSRTRHRQDRDLTSRKPRGPAKSCGPDSVQGVTWTIDVPEAGHLAASPLPGPLAAAVTDALARPAVQQPAGPTPAPWRGCGRCWRPCRRSRCPRRSTGFRSGSARSPAARRSCCRAATAPRRSPTTPRRTCGGRSGRCCRWRSCSPTGRRCRWSRSAASPASTPSRAAPSSTPPGCRRTAAT